MENYRKAGVVEQPCPCPFLDLPEGTPVVRVRDGSKIRNLMKFALGRMEARSEKTPEGCREPGPSESQCRQIVFTGIGPSVSKAITCVEIMKRRVPGLHQCTKVSFSTTQETWEPLEPSAGLDSITVSRNVPTAWVLLSRDELDRNEPGYQAPGNFDALWVQAAKKERESQKRKSGGGGGGGSGGGGGGGGRGGGGRGGRGGGGRGKGPRKQTPRERKAPGPAGGGQ